jgi:hypothetical protein
MEREMRGGRGGGEGMGEGGGVGGGGMGVWWGGRAGEIRIV